MSENYEYMTKKLANYDSETAHYYIIGAINAVVSFKLLSDKEKTECIADYIVALDDFLEQKKKGRSQERPRIT